MSATLADLNNTQTAAQAGQDHLQEVEAERTDAAISKAEAMATKKRLEAKHEADQENQIVMVPIADETVPLYPIEPGKVLEITRMLIEAERNGDDMIMFEAADEMRQLFVEKGYYPDVFDRDFWNAFERDEIRDAWNEWGQRSRNTDEPLGNR